ncbi:MAG: flagellum-specific ATP synthase FliI, partial [Deltaproteobacteria bacterium]|nr:flagellum-specific ATP synthase FliI [Deltaproteobacteria bacterium]
MNWNQYSEAVDYSQPLTAAEGRVVKVTGLIAEGRGPGIGIGSTCNIENRQGENLLSEVVGFNESRIMLMPYGEMRGISPGSKITLVHDKPFVNVGDAYLGRVVDGFGNPLDG